MYPLPELFTAFVPGTSKHQEIFTMVKETEINIAKFAIKLETSLFSSNNKL